MSALELARLIWGGSIRLQITADEWVEKSLGKLRAEMLPVTHRIALEAYTIPEPFHRDPSDRIIVACARLHGLTVVTADEKILGWNHVNSIDARK